LSIISKPFLNTLRNLNQWGNWVYEYKYVGQCPQLPSTFKWTLTLLLFPCNNRRDDLILHIRLHYLWNFMMLTLYSNSPMSFLHLHNLIPLRHSFLVAYFHLSLPSPVPPLPRSFHLPITHAVSIDMNCLRTAPVIFFELKTGAILWFLYSCITWILTEWKIQGRSVWSNSTILKNIYMDVHYQSKIFNGDQFDSTILYLKKCFLNTEILFYQIYCNL